MAKTPVAVQVLALIGVASVVGVLHSMVVPSNLTLEDTGGFTIPGSGAGSDSDLTGTGIAETNGESSGSPEARPSESEDDPEVQAEPVPEDSVEDGSGQQSGKVGLDQALELFDLSMVGEPVIFLDARLESNYAEGHISGALSMPFTKLGTDEGIDEILSLASPGDGTLFVIYCTGGDCEASEDTAIRLQELGFSNFAIMADGYDDWAGAGHPVSAPESGGGP